MYKNNLSWFEFINQTLLDEPERYFTKSDLLEIRLGRKLLRNAKEYESLKNAPLYDRLEGAFKKIKAKLKAKGLSLDFKNGKNANEGFRYPQGIEDPLAEETRAHHQMRQKQLLRLLSHSVGLLPDSWMSDFVDNFVKGANDGKIIDFFRSSSIDRIELVPDFYNAVEAKMVLQFSYRTKYGKEVVELLFHPYYIKEYNQRWFVFGKSTDLQGKPTQNSLIGIDRIVDEVIAREDVVYCVPKKQISSSDYFKDIVGVTRINAAKIEIEIAANDEATFYRIQSKKLHHSQRLKQVPVADSRGVFSIQVIPNPELDTLIMSFGENIEVLAPRSYREHIAQRIQSLARLYKIEQE